MRFESFLTILCGNAQRIYMIGLSFFRSEDDSGGIEEVVRALAEVRAGDEKYGVYGKPRLVEEGEYNKTTRVEIPIHSEYPVSPLRFDLDSDELSDFFDALNIEAETIGEIEGKTADIYEYGGGHYVEW